MPTVIAMNDEKESAAGSAVDVPAAINYETLPAQLDAGVMGEGLIRAGEKDEVDEESTYGHSDLKLGADRSDEKVNNNNNNYKT